MSNLGSVSVTDKAGDLVDVDGNPVPGPKYVDVRSLQAETDGADLLLRLTLAAAAPAKRSSKVEELNYVFAIDTTGDNEWEYWVNLDNREDGRYVGSLDDWSGDYYHYEGPAFRGSVIVVEDLALGRIPLETLESPSTIAVCVVAQRAEPSDGSVTAEDNAPDGDCLGGDLVRLKP